MVVMISRFYKFFCITKGEREFKKFIKAKSEKHFKNFPYGNLILVEGNQTSTNMIALATLLPILKNRYRANVVSYYTEPDKSTIQKMTNRVRYRFSIMRTISSKRAQFINSLRTQSPYLERFIKNIDLQNLTKFDFERIKYREILIGDLVYDNYLRKTKKLTLQLDDPDLVNYLIETCTYLDFFLDFIPKNNVKVVVVTHMVYNFALPARVGLFFGLDVFLCNAEVLFRVTNENYYAFDTHKHYPKLFSRVDKSRKFLYLNDAEVRLKSRLMGNLSDLPYFYSPLTPVTYNSREFESIRKAKFLVALHDFSDSPHFFGFFLFPDFYEWLKAIGEFSLENDVDFLIKPHPNSLFNQIDVINEILENFPNLSLINSNITNYQLGQLELNGCLTVYGTIAHEMAYMGIPVVNACVNNPHAGYQFSFTPKSIAEWQSILRTLVENKIEIDHTQILEYYAMNYLHHPISWILDNFSIFLTKVGSYREPDSNKTYQTFHLPEFAYNFENLQNSIQKFIESSDLRFSYNHSIISGNRLTK